MNESVLEKMEVTEVDGGRVVKYKDAYATLTTGKMGFFKGDFLTFTFTRSIAENELAKLNRKYRFGMAGLESVIKKRDTLILFVPTKVKDLDKYFQHLDSFLDLCNELDLQQYHNCFVCGKNEDASLISRNGFTVCAHKECIEKYNNVVEQEKPSEGKAINTPFSILLALGGCFVGLIPNIITIAFLGLYIGYLFALIPLCGYYGYQMGGGKKNAMMGVIIIIFSVLSVVLMLVWEYALMADELDFASLGALLKTNEYSSVFITDMLLGLVFAALGISVVWRKITGKDKTKKFDI